jgi:hypothetical protein
MQGDMDTSLDTHAKVAGPLSTPVAQAATAPRSAENTQVLQVNNISTSAAASQHGQHELCVHMSAAMILS